MAVMLLFCQNKTQKTKKNQILSSLSWINISILQGVFILGNHEMGSISGVQGKFKFSGIS
jgi:hypothetical protein